MKKKNGKVSDFEWQSAAAFFRYIAINAELIEYSLTSVYSFQVTKKTGFQGLAARKQALLKVLTENLERTSRWAKEQGDKIGPYQLVFVRSLYQTTRDLAAIVKEQAERAERLAADEEKGATGIATEEETQHDLPF